MWFETVTSHQHQLAISQKRTFFSMCGTDILRRAFLLMVSITALAQEYHVVGLGAPGDSRAGINNKRLISGNKLDNNGVYSAYIWGKGVFTILGPGIAYDINNLGMVAGDDGGLPNRRARLWSNGTFLDLGVLQVGDYSRAFGLNDRGITVGEDQDSTTFQVRPFVWTAAQGMSALPDLGGKYAGAFGINGLNQIVGYSGITGAATNVIHLAIWKNGAITDLGTFPGDNFTIGYKISDGGSIVGQSDTANGGYRAFLWKKGAYKDLGTVAGLPSGVAVDISKSGQIVGYSFDNGQNYRAWVYSRGKIHDLNSLISSSKHWLLQTATGINDKGEITGYGLHNGVTELYLLQPRSHK